MADRLVLDANMKIAVILTWVRIVLIPLMVFAYWFPLIPNGANGIAAAVVFLVAALTDWLDGFAARYFGQETRFGAFLDPVADKLLIGTALILLLLAESEPYARWILGILAMLIIGREICVSALREWMAEIGKRVAVEVSVLGKWKTAAQMIAIPLLLVGSLFGHSVRELGLSLLGVAGLLTFISMIHYLRAAWPHLGD